MRARLLGPSELVVGGRQISQGEWSGRKARSLLLLLLDTPGHAMSRDQALDLLWPDHDPDAASNALYKPIHAVRRVLEPALQTGRDSRFVELQGDTIALAAGLDLWIDAEQLAALIRRAEAAPPNEQRRLYREALSLVRGEYIADEPYADWLAARRTGIRAEIVRITLRLAKLDLDAEEPLDAAPALEALLALDPTLETAHRALMRAYAGGAMRSEALRQFEICRDQLRRELDEAPEPETEELADAIRSSFTSIAETELTLAGMTSPGHRRSLPSLPTPTVGRGRELAELVKVLLEPEVRLVTVTGVGGVGKTRLSTQLAIEIGQRSAADVVFVPLAAIREPELGLAAIGAALGLSENPSRSWIEQLTERLQSTETLLVLDNLEQITAIAEAVAGLVDACPLLTILATSRVPLRIRAEHCFKLDVLALPDTVSHPADLRAHGATELFLQTYEQLHHHEPEIDEANQAALAAICRHLDGLPLAIEIAASHCYERTPRQLWELLQEQSRVIFLRDGPRDLPERHRTLNDLIEWSYQLLPERSKRLFRLLAVFSGGIEQDALVAVAGEDAWQTAGALVDHNLVHWTQVHGVRRLGMLETVREVAQELLDEAGDRAPARARHLDFYAGYARQADEALRGPRQRVWFDRLERGLPNLRAAIDADLEPGDTSQQPQAAADIVTGTWLFWYYRGHVHEAITWLDRLDPYVPAKALPELRALYLAQVIAGRRIQDRARIDRFLALARAVTGDDDHDSVSLMLPIQEGILARQHGDLARSKAHLLAAIRRAETASDAWVMAESLQELSMTCLLLGDFGEALQVLEQAGALSRSAGDLLSESNAQTLRAVSAMQSGNAALAMECARVAERLCRLADNRSVLPWALYVQAAGAFCDGRYRRAISMLLELRQLFLELGNPRNRANVDVSLGAAYAAEGDLSAARSAFLRAIPETIRSGFSEDKTMCLLEVALFAASAGQAEQAVQLLAASTAQAGQIGHVFAPPDEERRAAATESLRAALGQAAFNTAWRDGESLDDAFALALAIDPQPLQRAS